MLPLVSPVLAWQIHLALTLLLSLSLIPRVLERPPDRGECTKNDETPTSPIWTYIRRGERSPYPLWKCSFHLSLSLSIVRLGHPPSVRRSVSSTGANRHRASRTLWWRRRRTTTERTMAAKAANSSELSALSSSLAPLTVAKVVLMLLRRQL